MKGDRDIDHSSCMLLLGMDLYKHIFWVVRKNLESVSTEKLHHVVAQSTAIPRRVRYDIETTAEQPNNFMME